MSVTWNVIPLITSRWRRSQNHFETRSLPVPALTSLLDRTNTNHYRLRGGRVTLICEIFNRHQHIRFREISRGATARNVIGHDAKTARYSLLTVVIADQIHDLSCLKSAQVNVFGIQKHDAPPVSNSAITIVKPINRRIELVMTSHGHHQELIGS